MSPGARPAVGSPRSEGYRMPGEWEPHDATWVAWPHQSRDWPGKFTTIPWTYAEIVRNLAASERVEVLVDDAPHERRARRVLRLSGVDTENVRFHVVPTDRSWTRDSGPTFVRRSSGSSPGIGLVHWQFTAWAKYEDWHLDRNVPEWIGKHVAAPVWTPKVDDRWVVLEGGAIDLSGDGLLLATEECLLGKEQERNPGITREQLEAVFMDYLGVRETLWLPRGIAGDDTHGHIDDLARFVGGRSVLVIQTEARNDPDYAALEQAREALESFRSQDGSRLTVRTLPAPRPVTFRGRRLPASYANFYIANRVVLVPTFDDPHDAEALAILTRAFPGREVVGIRARDLVWGLGTIHCLTQQQPTA